MELIKLVRFIMFIVWVAVGGYILYATASHPGLVVGVTAAAALGPYLRPWPLGAALTWAGACGMALLITGDSRMLELGLFGAPVVLVVFALIRFLTPKRA
ncbi:hypothetical protein DBR23_24735 [Acidovorax sp. HMWF018]|uniref:hypothetical protein n=1 Tax=Acidovorax sp. HMWF018 TaxID=2056855 RepID=UPI000D334DAD|nr:hypothetical protein [Acidovorax sp. HMWF018]PTT35022.1 hypothetical protein DBR23_24735 [Acidovorax sp. HMWF018]